MCLNIRYLCASPLDQNKLVSKLSLRDTLPSFPCCLACFWERVLYTCLLITLYAELCVENSVRLFIGDDDVAFYHGELDEAHYTNVDMLTRGRVEYCINETYYGICADDWGYVHASVVCRQRGFSEYGTKPSVQLFPPFFFFSFFLSFFRVNFNCVLSSDH